MDVSGQFVCLVVDNGLSWDDLVFLQSLEAVEEINPLVMVFNKVAKRIDDFNKFDEIVFLVELVDQIDDLEAVGVTVFVSSFGLSFFFDFGSSFLKCLSNSSNLKLNLRNSSFMLLCEGLHNFHIFNDLVITLSHPGHLVVDHLKLLVRGFNHFDGLAKHISEKFFVPILIFLPGVIYPLFLIINNIIDIVHSIIEPNLITTGLCDSG